MDTLSPSSDSSPLVKPLRVLPEMHRTHWASQSFPEQQTSVLSQQQTCVLSQQQSSVLSQQQTSILSQQKTEQLPAGGRQRSRLLLR